MISVSLPKKSFNEIGCDFRKPQAKDYFEDSTPAN